MIAEALSEIPRTAEGIDTHEVVTRIFFATLSVVSSATITRRCLRILRPTLDTYSVILTWIGDAGTLFSAEAVTLDASKSVGAVRMFAAGIIRHRTFVLINAVPLAI